MKSWAGLPLGVLAAFALAGCGSSPSSGATRPSSSPVASIAAAKPGCDLVPGSLVTEKLGISVGDPRVTANALVTTCMYAVGSNPSGVIIRFQIHSDHASFLNGKANFNSTSNVSGVGDEAYSSVLATYTALIARKGTVEIEITSKAALAAERGLMLTLLAEV
jgi:hypothetical protein